MVGRISQNILTYLTILSTIVLPVVLVLWVRSYTVDDILLRQGNGTASVLRSANGELSFWIARTDPSFRYFEHRKREPRHGATANRIFARIPGNVWFDSAGFAFAELDYLPGRGLMATGDAVGGIIPIWFFALISVVLPVRLLLRNTQSPAEWARQREAEEAERRAQEEAAQQPQTPDPILASAFMTRLPHRPMRTAAASMRRWR